MSYIYNRTENSGDERTLAILASIRPYADLHNQTLIGVDLSNRQLNNIGFVHSRLNNVLFDNSDLTGANFEGADLSGCSFRGSNLNNACFKDAILINCDFTGSMINFIILEGADITNAIFRDIHSIYIYADEVTPTYTFKADPLFIKLINSTEPPPPIERSAGSYRLKNPPTAIKRSAHLSPSTKQLLSVINKKSVDKITHKHEAEAETPAFPPGTEILISEDEITGRAPNPGNYSVDGIPMVPTRITNPPDSSHAHLRSSFSVDDSPGKPLTRSRVSNPRPSLDVEDFPPPRLGRVRNGASSTAYASGGAKGIVERLVAAAGFDMPQSDLDSIFSKSLDSHSVNTEKKSALEDYIKNLSRRFEIERDDVGERTAAKEIARQCLIALETVIR